jgi:hypothetical protein
MDINYRLTTCIIGLLTGAIIFRLVRRNLLHGSYAAWWLAAGAFAVLVGIFPGSFDILGHALGVGYPPVLFLTLALAAFAIRMLISDVERTRMELTQRRLVQRYAHMALRLRHIEQTLGLTIADSSAQPHAAAPEDRDGSGAPQPPEPMSR